MNKCYVGIDPSFRKDGFGVCIIDENREVNFIVFKDFLMFLNWIFEAPENCIFCIENSNLQNVTFNVPFKPNMNISYYLTALKRSRDAGKNMAISQNTVDLCRRVFGHKKVYEVSPAQKGAKYSKELFPLILKQDNNSKVLNYKNLESEQDKRDAYQLATLGRKLSILKPQ